MHVDVIVPVLVPSMRGMCSMQNSILKTYEKLKIHVQSLKQDRKKELESLERSSEIMADLRNGLSFSMMTFIWVQRA